MNPTEDYTFSISRQIAAQCWCDEETKHIEFDARLAEAFAKRLDLEIEAAHQYAKNADYYRNILMKIKEILDPLTN
jgi:hypothetical protein